VLKFASITRGAIVALAALVAASGAPVAGAQGKITIGAIIYARDSQFWQQVEKGMRDAAKANDAEILIGMNRRQLPVEGQLVDDYVTRGVNVLIMPPLDKQASAAAAKRAKDKGILVVDYDTALEEKSIASHTIGVDSFELAKLVGNEMRKYIDTQLNGQATVGLITLPPINANSKPRRDGVMSALQGTKIEIVAEASGSTPEQGANGVETILQRNPNTQLIWASNAGTIAGGAVAAQRAKSTAKIYGIDMSQQLAEMLLDPNSNLMAVSDQQPYRVGYLAVETAVKAKRGQAQPRNVSVPPKLYTRSDPKGVHEYLDLLKTLSTQ
jgi:ABC-type sugar transport system substrate-binding protein